MERVHESPTKILARWESFLDSARDAVVCIDPEGTILLFNTVAEEIFGHPRNDVVGGPVSRLMPEPWAAEHDQYLARYRTTGEPHVIGRIRNVEGLRASGELFPVELSVSEMREGDFTVYLAIIRDMTEHWRTAEHLRQRERLADIGALAARIVHDVANPLAGLTMLAERIRRRIERTPNAPVSSVAAATEQIDQTIRQLERLVQDFKDFVREQRLQQTSIDVPAFLREVIEFWRLEAAAHAVELRVRVPNDTPPVRGDRDKLRRVLDNLLKNALEAIDHGPGTVDVDVSAADHVLRVVITDSGSGVPEHVDPFALFETTKRGGTGLGLPVCRQIVEAHGGRIALASREVGGAEAVVELPFDGPPHPRSAFL
jgi:two-component system sensor kinase FixL